jgi:hypothetical protein
MLSYQIKKQNTGYHNWVALQVAVDRAILSYQKSINLNYKVNYKFQNLFVPEDAEARLKSWYSPVNTSTGISYTEGYLLSMQILLVTCVLTFCFIPIMSLSLSLVGGEKRKKLLAPLRR